MSVIKLRRNIGECDNALLDAWGPGVGGPRALSFFPVALLTFCLVAEVDVSGLPVFPLKGLLSRYLIAIPALLMVVKK